MNLNQVVRVKLTDEGRQSYEAYRSNMMALCHGRVVLKPPPEDAEGYQRFRLWELFEIFAQSVGMARKPVFENNEILTKQEDTLKRIAKWEGEFPELVSSDPDRRPMSYGAAFGSNGERDYMRQLAREALEI